MMNIFFIFKFSKSTYLLDFEKSVKGKNFIKYGFSNIINANIIITIERFLRIIRNSDKPTKT